MEPDHFLSEVWALSKFIKMSCKGNKLANKKFTKTQHQFSIKKNLTCPLIFYINQV